MNIDLMVDMQTIVNYAKTKMENNEARANQWFFNPCELLNQRRPSDVLENDVDGFKKCIDALDKRALIFH